MNDHDWAGFVRCLGMRLAGDLIEEVDERGRRIEGDTILVLFNAHHDQIPFTLPSLLTSQRWQRLLDTAHAAPVDGAISVPYPLVARSLAVFRTRHAVDPAKEQMSPEVGRVLMDRSR